VARGEHRALSGVEPRTLLFLVLSGVTTGLSWLAYFRALQLGPASRVAPIDKLSLPFVMLLSWLFLGEVMTAKSMVGAGLMVVGALLTLR
jgi:transporter family protein